MTGKLKDELLVSFMNEKEVEEIGYKNFFPNVVPTSDDEILLKTEIRVKGKYYFDVYHGNETHFHSQNLCNVK